MRKLNSYAAAPLRFAFVTSREQKQKKNKTKQNKTSEQKQRKRNTKKKPKETKKQKKQIYLYASKTFHIYIKYILTSLEQWISHFT